MKIGYARVSTDDQNLDLQINALTDFGCNKIYTDKISGSSVERDGLSEALNFCRRGDTLVVWKLDRLSRSLKHLIETVEDLGDRGVDFMTLDQKFDTTSPTGRLLFNIVGSFCEFERTLIVERTKAGLEASKARGVKLGRPHKVTTTMVTRANELLSKNLSITEICQVLEISRTSFYNQINPLLH